MQIATSAAKRGNVRERVRHINAMFLIVRKCASKTNVRKFAVQANYYNKLSYRCHETSKHFQANVFKQFKSAIFLYLKKKRRKKYIFNTFKKKRNTRSTSSKKKRNIQLYTKTSRIKAFTPTEYTLKIKNKNHTVMDEARTYVFQSINLHWKLRASCISMGKTGGERKRGSVMIRYTGQNDQARKITPYCSLGQLCKPTGNERARAVASFYVSMPMVNMVLRQVQEMRTSSLKLFLIGLRAWRTKKRNLCRSSMINPSHVTVRRSTIFWLIILYEIDFLWRTIFSSRVEECLVICNYVLEGCKM